MGGGATSCPHGPSFYKRCEFKVICFEDGDIHVLVSAFNLTQIPIPLLVTFSVSMIGAVCL